MKLHYVNLGDYEWTLYGTMPYAWRNGISIELGLRFEPEIGPIATTIPKSVQQTLLEANIIPDWRFDLNTKDIEWIENRHWIYCCTLPSSIENRDSLSTRNWVLRCDGLDYAGWVYINSTLVGTFSNSFIPHEFSIKKELLVDKEHVLRIIFKEPPRWLGQLGYTSKIRDWKPRFNYTWDWIPRVVQTAITGSIGLVCTDVPRFEIDSIDCAYDREKERGSVITDLIVDEGVSTSSQLGTLKVAIYDQQDNLIGSNEKPIRRAGLSQIVLEGLEVKRWYPNGLGDQNLYWLDIALVDPSGVSVQNERRQIGFKHIHWRPCEGAPAEATPWICEVNGNMVFLQGINWTPLSPTYADVTLNEVEKRLHLYQQMGCNVVRVWGGAVLETEGFYDHCDRLGLMVWQELPLSSSGIDNWPPEDPEIIESISLIATSYIKRRMHHVSLLMYSGGNELQGNLDGEKRGTGKPIDFSHPMMQKLKEVFTQLDPARRFIPTSPFGPRFKADREENNMGLHWSIHGPWNVDGVLDERWSTYWSEDDSLLRAETGCPGAMDPKRLIDYVPSLNVFPIEQSNPVWGRTSWWIESDVFETEFGRKPETIEEYVQWSQHRQAKALSIAAYYSKIRFPSCGGIIVWMGHDCYPCAANTSLIDVDSNPKPAYHAVQNIFTKEGRQLYEQASSLL